MTMRQVDFLLVGGGLASVTAARTLRMEDAAASIAILSGEAVLPYQRPPLTKGFLDGSVSALQIAIRPAEFYAEQRIDLMLGARAVRVDAKGHVVHLADGSAIGYGKLLIATGVSPRAPELPGMGLAGVYSLHTLADASAVRDAAVQSGQSGRTKHAVVLGAGFVGIETAASLRALGLAVTVIERQHAVMPQLRAPMLSAYFAKRCADHGVEVKTDCLVERLVGREGAERVEGVVTNTGETIACDLVVAAMGVAPNCAFLEGSGVALADGVVVDDCLQSSHPDIYAAGDVASFFDPVFGVRRRIEHWDNARRQGSIAARNMRGGRFPYRDVSMFFGDAFGQPYNFLGYPHGVTETVERGSLEAGSYSLLYLKHDVLRAIFSLGRTAGETSAAEELIRLRISLHGAKPRLADTAFPLDRLPEQTVLILQGGGALGAFECGAIRALEEKGVRPDVISAVSIGAFNAAIVASHPGEASRALAAFWRDVSIPLPTLPRLPGLPTPFAGGDDSLHSALLSWYVLWFGVPNFLRPRWWNPNLGLAAWLPWWTSLYDTSPVRTLMERYVDFDALAASPTRLLLSAVDVATGEPRIFDSYVDRIGPEHLLASGSLPPGMPWTMVDGRAYWDGGIVSNSPLDLVIERCGRIGGRIFAVDLFSGTRAMPSNLLEVMLRRDEIVYTDRVRNDLRFEEYANDFSDLVDEILKQVDEPTARRIRQRPHFIRLMGNRAPIRIARIALDGEPLSLSSDFDFSAATVARLQTRGYEAALAVLARDEVPVAVD